MAHFYISIHRPIHPVKGNAEKASASRWGGRFCRSLRTLRYPPLRGGFTASLLCRLLVTPYEGREERESCCLKLYDQSRTGCHWPTMEPSVKPFSVSLIRREPRSSEARWREADWNGEAENGSEATLCRPGAPRPAATSNVVGGRVRAIRPYSS